MKITALAGFVALAAGCGHTTMKQTSEPRAVRAPARPTPAPTPPPVEVRATQIRIAEKVQFASGSAQILPGSFALLREVAAVLEQNRRISLVQVEGHTDGVGKTRRNRKLSQRRAEAVRAFLIDEGVAPERLVAAGFGEQRPVAQNDTDEGREENRRVEFNVLEQTDQVAKK